MEISVKNVRIYIKKEFALPLLDISDLKKPYLIHAIGVMQQSHPQVILQERVDNMPETYENTKVILQEKVENMTETSENTKVILLEKAEIMTETSENTT